jgi:hypothetical protein
MIAKFFGELAAARAALTLVVAGLDPAIHPSSQALSGR